MAGNGKGSAHGQALVIAVLAGLAAGPAVWAGLGETRIVAADPSVPLPQGWVITRRTDGAVLNGLTGRRDLGSYHITDLNGAPFGRTERILTLSPIPEGWAITGEDYSIRPGSFLRQDQSWFTITNLNGAPHGHVATLLSIAGGPIPYGWILTDPVQRHRGASSKPSHFQIRNSNPSPAASAGVEQETERFR
jgi:hypothetical protein